METSILTSTKKILGLTESYTSFDLDILTHINMALSTANQIGLGATLYNINDSTAQWSSLGLPVDQLNLLKTYIFLKVKMVFDPPPTSFAQDAMKQQISELESRLYYLSDAVAHPLEGEIV